jgi:putative Mg2+ transporter-C (MgtC) family protein
MFEKLSPFVESYPFPLWEGILRITVALLLGAIIGLERERRRQPAGFRTHSVLAVGSAFLSIVSIYIPTVYGSGINVDPSRIASQVVSGIGFLGAGAILRMGVSVKGLTTAASLWTTAGIGLGVGAGMYILSIFSTLILLLVLSLMSKVEREFISKKLKTLRIVADDVPNLLEKLEDLFEEGSVSRIRKGEGYLELYLEVPYEEEDLRHRLKELMKVSGVKSVEAT